MAVKMRLTRVGSKKNPIYRVVVADSHSPRDGRFIEIVGRYNPQSQPSLIEFDEAKVKDWLGQGRAADRAGQPPAQGQGAPWLSSFSRSRAGWSTTPAPSRSRSWSSDGEILLRLTVAEADRGKVIGRQGRIVRALRTLVRAGGVREGRRYLLEIAE